MREWGNGRPPDEESGDEVRILEMSRNTHEYGTIAGSNPASPHKEE